MVIPAKLNRGEDDAPFNMAQLYYFRLNELLALKSKCKIYGETIGWFEAITEIYTQICFKLSDKENTDLDARLKTIRQYINTPGCINKKTNAQVQAIVGNRTGILLGELDRDVMRLMNKYKMIFPRIDTRTPMNKLRDDYGLQPKEGV